MGLDDPTVLKEFSRDYVLGITGPFISKGHENELQNISTDLILYLKTRFSTSLPLETVLRNDHCFSIYYAI